MYYVLNLLTIFCSPLKMLFRSKIELIQFLMVYHGSIIHLSWKCITNLILNHSMLWKLFFMFRRLNLISFSTNWMYCLYQQTQCMQVIKHVVCMIMFQEIEVEDACHSVEFLVGGVPHLDQTWILIVWEICSCCI